MSVEFIGFISNNNSSETIVRTGPVLDVTHIETVAKAHELAGFDRALLAFHSTTPDGDARPQGFGFAPRLGLSLSGTSSSMGSAMPQDTTNLIEVLLLIFGVVIAGLAIGGAVQAWRSWSDHRRIEKHLGRR